MTGVGDISTEVVLFEPSSVGRKGPLGGGKYFACPFVVGGEAFDCRLLIEGRTLALGQMHHVDIVFLQWGLVAPTLKEGTRFALLQGCTPIAEGVVTSVNRPPRAV